MGPSKGDTRSLDNISYEFGFRSSGTGPGGLLLSGYPHA